MRWYRDRKEAKRAAKGVQCKTKEVSPFSERDPSTMPRKGPAVPERQYCGSMKVLRKRMRRYIHKRSAPFGPRTPGTMLEWGLVRPAPLTF